MIQQVAEFGKGYKPPCSESLRTTILHRSKERLTNKLESIKETWKHTGCTIISDGWSNMKHRPLINVLVYSPQGVLFVKAVDTMDHKKTSEFIFKILEEAVLDVGEENVIQIVTDSASNCVGAGKLIMDRFKTIYWTPCAAHYLDLLLHDLGKLPWVNEVIRRGKKISNFVVNHRLTLSIYRKHAMKELLRPCDIRFATYYIMLKRVVEEKDSLRLIVCNNEWDKSPLSKTSKGKLVEEIILSNNFWDSVERVLNMCEPIVEMLRLVNGDTPCMGFIYDGMEHCKDAIERVFNNVVDDYKLIWNMVDFKWKMMHSPLHAVACYLDPRIFGLKRNADKEIMSGLYASIEKLNPDREVAKKVREQLKAYKLQEGIFGSVAAKDDRICVDPGLWWDFYGAKAPELQCFAI
eukprot:Gb_40424 [translate_table: standard]